MNRSGFLSFLSSLLVIVIGLLFGLIVLIVSNAEQAFPAARTIATFGFSSMRRVGDVMLHGTPIILTGLSVAFAFKTGLFNIGASGQFMFGGFVAIYIGVEATFLPPWLRILTCIVAAALAGAIWGAIPGLLKAYRNVHEVISSIMTNYIGMFIVVYLIQSFVFDQGRGTSTRLPTESTLPRLGFQNIFREPFFATYRESHVNLGIVLAIAIAILVYVILEKTTFGYELKACGFNPDAAKYAGINQKRSIVFSMMISGALAGTAGALNFMVDTGLSMGVVETLAMEGFTGISVAFLGMNHPIGIIFSGLFVSYIKLGGAQLQPHFSIEMVETVLAIIIYFCAFVFVVKSMLGRGLSKFGRKDKQEGGGAV
ncbi:MAG: ABC transporter permease [Defluviitaleaceae bacterium]|nr:ABC transporter permease [Defluviitaleaceae bacterium]